MGQVGVPSIKGALIIALVKALRARRAEAILVLPERLHRYLAERVMASSWYPEDEYVELCKALAGLNTNMPDIWWIFGTRTARVILDSVYGALAIRGDPARTLKKLPSYWSLYHNTGHVEVAIDDESHARFEIFDYVASSPDMCRAITGFYTEVILGTGAQGVIFDKKSCQAVAATHCRWNVRWRLEQS